LDAATGRVTDVNPFLVKLLGFSRDEMVGKTVGELSPFKDVVSNQAMLERLQKDGYVRYEDLPLETRAGRQIAVEFVSNVYQAGNEKVIQCNIRDITKRKRAEESHARLATAVDQAAETIVITDTQGAIQYANPAFAKTTGYTVTEAIGQNPKILQSGKQDAEFYRRMWATLTRGETWTGHFINRRKDGTLFEEDATISPVRDAAGTIVNYVAVKRDVTHELHLEARFQQAQKMESIGQLAGGIAHDFNNILACIVGYLFLAKLAAAKSPEVTGYLEHITKATDRAVDLVNQILTFSRQNKPEREPVVLNHVVLEALKLLWASLPASVRIQTELTETPAVLANATAIHQVIMNLGTNAWHAMRGQPGTLKVEMSVLDVDAAFASSRPDLRPGRYVRLAVSDTGCGMDAATQARIFEPFFTTNGAGGGTGLGLAVVHGIMKTHEGAISVYSHLGEGTTFNLYFPVLETAASAPKIASRPIPRGAGEQILFVDDEVPLATLGQQVLDRLGYRVTMMTSPVAALAAVRAEPEKFDLVITDLSMPGMDGAKLGAELLLLRPGLPIILTTGFSSFMTAGKVRELGFRELMVKPGTVQTLGETVHRVLHPPAAAGVNTP
jgi:PAS domain S-box-containing protein